MKKIIIFTIASSIMFLTLSGCQKNNIAPGSETIGDNDQKTEGTLRNLNTSTESEKNALEQITY